MVKKLATKSINSMKSNEDLQRDVQNAIKWEPLLTAAQIGVTVKDGIVTLSGVVDTYAKKIQAETAAKNVSGVKAVAENIEVNYGSSFIKNDTEIATEILNAWRWNWEIPEAKIKVKVENGWVTLDGEVEWNYQKDAAKKAIVNLTGVKGVSNNVSIKTKSHDAIEEGIIEKAFDRSWIDDSEIEVKVAGHTVNLKGTVNSIYERDEAGRIAWNTPGIWLMHNDLVVEYNY